MRSRSGSSSCSATTSGCSIATADSRSSSSPNSYSPCSTASLATVSSYPSTWFSSTSGMMRVIPSTISARTSWCTATPRERKPGGTAAPPGTRAHRRTLDRDRGLDRGVRVVCLEVEILVTEIEDVPYRRVEPHARQRPRRASELLSRLLHMVRVEVRIAEGMHEFARLQLTYLRHHQREQRIGSDVERHTEENVRAALVHLAGKPSIRHVELKQDVAR